MSDKNAGQRFFADALMAVGALITVLCGGCTVFFLGGAIWTVLQSVLHHGPLSPAERYDAGYVPVVGIGAIIVGGLPTAVGVVIFLSGRRMKRRATAPPRRDLNGTFS